MKNPSTILDIYELTTFNEHIRIEFDDSSVKELSEQEAKELHSDLGKLLSKSNSEENHPIMEWSKDWKTPNVFGPDPNIIYYYNQPTAQPLNVEVKTVDDNVVTERNLYRTRTLNCC